MSEEGVQPQHDRLHHEPAAHLLGHLQCELNLHRPSPSVAWQSLLQPSVMSTVTSCNGRRKIALSAPTCGGAFKATTMLATNGTSSIIGFMTIRHTPFTCTTTVKHESLLPQMKNEVLPTANRTHTCSYRCFGSLAHSCCQTQTPASNFGRADSDTAKGHPRNTLKSLEYMARLLWFGDIDAPVGL